MDTYPSPFYAHVRTAPGCNAINASEAEMKSYGLAAVAPWAITHPSPPSSGTGGTGGLGKGAKAVAKANLQIELPDFNPENLPE